MSGAVAIADGLASVFGPEPLVTAEDTGQLSRFPFAFCYKGL